MSQLLPMSNFKWFTDKEMKDLDVMMIPDDSSRRYILVCDLAKYYFYCFYIYVYFIKCNIFFLCISEYPRDFIKSNVSFLCIWEYPHELRDVHKDYTCAWMSLDSRKHAQQLSTLLVARWRIQQTSTQARPEFTQQNELHHPLMQFKVVLGTGIASHQLPSCFIIWSIAMVEKLHQLQHLPTYSCKQWCCKRFL